jgi:aminoglycoside phosphotransferase (APT) family kinase protein
MTSPIDQPRPVRAGEELDLERLATFLGEHDIAGPVSAEQFPSGFSNLTYLVRAGGRELVLRRPPFGANVRGGHDMGREHRILARLDGLYAKAPRPVAYCGDASVLGAPFYLMERVRGVILRGGDPASPEAPAPEVMRGLSESFAADLAGLHAIDADAAGLGDLGKPAGYVERQVRGWSERYLKARTDDVPAVEHVARWLDDHRPGEAGASIVHNDFKFDNVVLDPSDLTRIVGVLDWEMATLGDPLMDLGTTLGYWFDPDDPPELLGNAVRGPTTLPGTLRRADLVERYARASGREVGDAVFYYVFGLFKIAVIAQQIYARYKLGHTRDPRFAGLLASVQALGRTAERAIARGRIDRLDG